MKKRYLACLMASLFATGAAPVTGAGYESFVVSVPYDFAVPPEFVSAIVGCRFTFEYGERRNIGIRANVPLDNGRASGTAHFGYDLAGTTPDLVEFTQEQSDLMRQFLTSEDFEIVLLCGLGYVERADASQAQIADSERFGQAIWDGTTPLHYLDDNGRAFYEIMLTADSNEVRSSPASVQPGAITNAQGQATANVPAPRLPGLSSILEGK